MIFARKIGPVFVSAVIVSLCAGSLRAQETGTNALPGAGERPNAFGTQDYTVTTISATAFTPVEHSMQFFTSGSLGRFGAINVLSEFYASLDVPAGAVIDIIGLNSNTSVASAFKVELIRRTSTGFVSVIGTLNSQPHGWGTDFNPGFIGYFLGSAQGEALILKVEQASNPDPQFFGWVEVWWRRSVSPAPVTATFGDVPVGHQQHRFVEALVAAGITAGCGGGNYCPNDPITRGQMAVFLSVALGLHFAP